ncbi:MAG: hypothetical protein ACK4FG_01040 [Brevundimonas sp.]
MRKTIIAISAGLMLIAGQAAAAGSNSAVARVGDRVGGRTGDAEQFFGAPVSVLVIGGAVLVATLVVASDDGDSD